MHFLDPIVIIKAFGLIGIFAIVFAESGLFFGFFLPGDSLLFTAGLLASQGFFNVFVLWIGTFIFAVLGDSVGYAFGRRVGPKIFRREDSFFFHRNHVMRAEKFYEKYGKKTIVLARFIPVVRTFVPIVAGVGKMEYRTFVFYNVFGGFIWTTLMIFLGYILGQLVPNIEKYILPIVIFIIFVSFLPPAIEFWKEKKKREDISHTG